MQHINPGQHETDDELLEPWSYILNIPGKNIRGKMIDAFQEWLNIPEEKVFIIKDIVGNLHNASLLMDDIEDDSELRRGIPVAHAIYGVPSTINCANYVYFLALRLCHSLQNHKAMDVYVLEMLNLHRGQGHDIRWRETGNCPTEEEYRKMVIDKTGGLFRLAVGLMQAFSESTTDYTLLVNKMGLYFQIRDDYLNIASPAYMKHKCFCEDLTEGKFSFPVVHAIRAAPKDHRLLSILKKRTKKVDIKKHAVEFMKQMGSFDYTRNALNDLKDEILQEIQSVGGNESLSSIVLALHQQLDDQSTQEIPEIQPQFLPVDSI